MILMAEQSIKIGVANEGETVLFDETSLFQTIIQIMSITRAIQINHFDLKSQRGWDKTFWF